MITMDAKVLSFPPLLVPVLSSFDLKARRQHTDSFQVRFIGKNTALSQTNNPKKPKLLNLTMAAVLPLGLGISALGQSEKPVSPPVSLPAGQDITTTAPKATKFISTPETPAISKGEKDPSYKNAMILWEKIRAYPAYHAVNSEKNLAQFLKDRRYQALEMDLRMRENTIVLAHMGVNHDAPPLRQRLDKLLSLPKEKVRIIKLDIKEKAVIPPLIELLQDSQTQDPDKWAERILILNADIPIGDIGKNRKIPLEDLQQLHEAFPNAVLSFGFPWYKFGISPHDQNEIENTLKALGDQTKTISFYAHTKINQTAYVMFERNNTFVTLESPISHIVPRYGWLKKLIIKISRSPKEQKALHWIDF